MDIRHPSQRGVSRNVDGKPILRHTTRHPSQRGVSRNIHLVTEYNTETGHPSQRGVSRNGDGKTDDTEALKSPLAEGCE